MNTTATMLQTHPGQIPQSQLEVVAQCLDACQECAQACTQCADACLSLDPPMNWLVAGCRDEESAF